MYLLHIVDVFPAFHLSNAPRYQFDFWTAKFNEFYQYRLAFKRVRRSAGIRIASASRVRRVTSPINRHQGDSTTDSSMPDTVLATTYYIEEKYSRQLWIQQTVLYDGDSIMLG